MTCCVCGETRLQPPQTLLAVPAEAKLGWSAPYSICSTSVPIDTKGCMGKGRTSWLPFLMADFLGLPLMNCSETASSLVIGLRAWQATCR